MHASTARDRAPGTNRNRKNDGAAHLTKCSSTFSPFLGSHSWHGRRAWSTITVMHMACVGLTKRRASATLGTDTRPTLQSTKRLTARRRCARWAKRGPMFRRRQPRRTRLRNVPVRVYATAKRVSVPASQASPVMLVSVCSVPRRRRVSARGMAPAYR